MGKELSDRVVQKCRLVMLERRCILTGFQRVRPPHINALLLAVLKFLLPLHMRTRRPALAGGVNDSLGYHFVEEELIFYHTCTSFTRLL